MFNVSIRTFISCSLLFLIVISGSYSQVSAEIDRDLTLNFTFSELLTELLSGNGQDKATPRRLVTNQSGKLYAPFKRLFLQYTPMDADEAVIQLEKTGGSGKTAVTISAVDEMNHQSVLHTFTIDKGKSNTGTVWNKVVSGIKGKRLAVYLEGKSLFRNLQYTLYLKRNNEGDVWQPAKYTYTEPVAGFVDLHNHQINHMGYAGGMTCGSCSESNLTTVYDACEGKHSVDLAGITLLEGSTTDYSGIQGPAWDDKIVHQSMPLPWLKVAHENGLNLMFVSVVNNEWLCAAAASTGRADPGLVCNDMESVKRQIVTVKKIDEENDWYTVVNDPWEARSAINRGELAVVLSVEVSNLFPKDDGDYIRQLHELYSMGVRSVQMAHETNSRFMGAAMHHDILTTLNKINAFFSTDIDFETDGSQTANKIGISDEGKILLDEMIRLNMLIDIAHCSLVGQREIYTIIKNKHNYYPIFNSHTRIGELLTPEGTDEFKEYVTTDETLGYIRSTGGMLGLRSGADPMLQYTTSNGQIENNCDGSVRSYIQFYQYATDHGINVGFGSDFMGMCTQLAPRYGADACAMAAPDQLQIQTDAQGPVPNLTGADMTGIFKPYYSDYYNDYLIKGLAHVGLLPAVLLDMKKLGVETGNLESSAENALRMWERIYDETRTMKGVAPGS